MITNQKWVHSHPTLSNPIQLMEGSSPYTQLWHVLVYNLSLWGNGFSSDMHCVS